MNLDSFKTQTVAFQIQYPVALALWDHAGVIGQQLMKIWPGLTLKLGQALLQTFASDRVAIQTGLSGSTITISGEKALEQGRITQIAETFEVWRELLTLDVLDRISSRVIYGKEFGTAKEANAALLDLNLATWSDTKVFDQPVDGEKNGLEIAWRFEDDSSFSVLRLRVEQQKAEMELDPEFFDESRLSRTKHKLVIDFDRGLLGSANAKKLIIDEWFKGFQHVFRRDIDKVLKIRK